MEKWLKKVEMRGIILTWAVNLPYKSEFGTFFLRSKTRMTKILVLISAVIFFYSLYGKDNGKVD